MTILAIVPYAGSKKLVTMTNSMLAQFHVSMGPMRQMFRIVAFNNAADGDIDRKLVDFHYWSDEGNIGFGRAMNLMVRRELYDAPKAGHPQDVQRVLLLNNDLEFPDRNWLHELVSVKQEKLVLSPCTDVTATKVAVAEHATFRDPVRADQVSAFCWLVPVTTIELIRKKFGFELFHPEFSNYGSDDVTGACLRSLLGPKPFKVVPRSWVRHLKAQTANELGVKAGTKELLQRIANYKRARRLS